MYFLSKSINAAIKLRAQVITYIKTEKFDCKLKMIRSFEIRKHFESLLRLSFV